MKRYMVMRVLKAIFTIWAVYTLVFVLTRVTGDPIEWLTLAGASDSAKEILRNNLGLDLPLWQQYVKSFLGLFTGDTGMSYYYARSVSDLFAERIGPTLSLGGGIGTVQHLVLPVVALSVGPVASVARLTRSSLLDVINQDYLDCARAKGMREWSVIIKHGLRNALISVITILGTQLSALIGGSVVVETVFAWPGIGTLIVSSAQQRDFPVVMFGVLVIAASVAFINLLVDLSYGLLDPRIRGN